MRAESVIASILLVACGGTQQPAAPGTPVAMTSAAPSASVSSVPPKTGPRMHAKTSMKMDGPIQTPAIMDAINERSATLGACIPSIRKTDKVVGSLNLQIKVDLQGVATADLQSPLSEEAKKCVLDALAGLKVSSGPGRAMVLLEIEE